MGFVVSSNEQERWSRKNKLVWFGLGESRS
jgi:hypothetical protein